MEGLLTVALMRTYTGKLIDPLQPDPALVCIEDVAFDLAGIFRFGGASRLTVAQHCCEMADYAFNHAGFQNTPYLWNLAFDCLMHDAPEYLLGDLIRPIKHHSRMGLTFQSIEHGVAEVLRKVFGNGHGDPLALDVLDRRMCATELQSLFTHADPTLDASPLPVNLSVWDPITAEQRFLDLYHHLKPMQEAA